MPPAPRSVHLCSPWLTRSPYPLCPDPFPNRPKRMHVRPREPSLYPAAASSTSRACPALPDLPPCPAPCVPPPPTSTLAVHPVTELLSTAREEMKQSLALQREGLRSPSPERKREMQRQMTRARDVEAGFKKWMLEFMQRVGGRGAAWAGREC